MEEKSLDYLKRRYPFLERWMGNKDALYDVKSVRLRDVDLESFSRSVTGVHDRIVCFDSDGECVGLVGHSYYMPNPRWRWWMNFRIIRRGLIPRDIRLPGGPLPSVRYYICPRYDRPQETLAKYVRRLPAKDMSKIRFIVHFDIKNGDEYQHPHPTVITIYEVPISYLTILDLLEKLQDESDEYLI